MDRTKDAFKNKAKFRQFTAAIIVNLTAVSYGITCGWPSPMITLLEKANNPVSAVSISIEGASWLGALLCLGAFFTTPFLGSLIEKLGRKYFGYVTFVPMILLWLMSIFATNYTWLYAARFMSGIAGAMSLFLIPIYISEIASEDVRGTLGSLLVLAINIGILLAFIAGNILTYTVFNLFSMLFPILFIGLFVFLPETPIYLIRQNRLKEAIRSLMYFTGDNKALVDKEIARLQCQIENITNSRNKSGICIIFKDRATRKGMIISLILLSGQQFGGIFAMVIYAETIFKMSGSAFSPATAAIIIGSIQVFGSYLSTVLMERVGRRPLVLVSCSGMCICHYVVGIFCIMQDAGYDVSFVSFAPVLSLSIYMIMYCLGMGPVPFVVASEVFRVNVNSLANNIFFAFLWAMAFFVLKMFSFMIHIVGVGSCFLFFGTSCALCFCLSYALLPETKGRKREEIVEELAGVTAFDQSHYQKRYINDKCATNQDLIASEQV